MMRKETAMTDSTEQAPITPSEDTRRLTVEKIDSVALARLIEEVRNEGAGSLGSPTTYNRTYHRHNR
jgi:hypothetical protein